MSLRAINRTGRFTFSGRVRFKSWARNLIGFAAVAIDLAVGFNDRRQDQTAADIGVMAGAIETLAPNTLIRDKILDFTRRNIIATYTNADWQARWEACTDPERATLNASGFNFVPVAAPAGWSVATVGCISFDAGGFVRVNLPDLEFSTTLGKIFGIVIPDPPCPSS